MVDTSGLMQYNSSPTTTVPIHRSTIPTQFMVDNAYTMAPMASQQAPQYPSNNHFIFGPYSPSTPSVASSFKSYQEEGPHPRAMTIDTEAVPAGYQRETCPTYSGEQDEIPQIKYEPQVATRRTPTPPAHAPAPAPVASKTITRNVAEDVANEVAFHTEIDTLMKAIQSKGEVSKASSDFGESAYPSPPQLDEEKFNLRRKSCSPEETKSSNSSPFGRDRQKRYVCDIKGCGKRCSQKTQLETHKRAHTGEKPFICPEPGCGQAFTQRGNLKTHRRRHTGEKPYQCEICGKAFAQLGNVKPHKLTHFPTRPFHCILDGCAKTFTQRGNLKNHHNTFHKDTIKELTTKFRNLGLGEELPREEQRLFTHFAELYKNSNKGIKGRGLNRKVAPKNQDHVMNATRQFSVPPTLPLVQNQTYQTHLPQQNGLSCSESYGEYGMSRPGPRGHIASTRGQHTMYGSYDMDQASITSSEAGTASNSPSTIYEDEYGRAFAAHHRIY